VNLRTTNTLQEETGVEIGYLVPGRYFQPPMEPLLRVAAQFAAERLTSEGPGSPGAFSFSPGHAVKSIADMIQHHILQRYCIQTFMRCVLIRLNLTDVQPVYKTIALTKIAIAAERP
jgi:hypothetical protein